MIDFKPLRAAGAARVLADKIAEISTGQPMRFMEVCGTHTMAIAKYGLRTLLPPEIRLVSGPGCPVCVTPNAYLDHALRLAERSEIIITTFGDMLRVPGTLGSLESARSEGADVRMVSSTLEALALAETHPQREVVFLGVGFETTAPTVAAALLEAQRKRLTNFSVLTAHKTMPMPLRVLSEDTLQIDGFILPGHVSAIIGSAPYSFLVDEFNTGGVVSGFEPLDILESLYRLVRQVKQRQPAIENQYTRVVRSEGNTAAQALIHHTFIPDDAHWRGLGMIPGSGLSIVSDYAAFDAAVKFDISVPASKEPDGCRCGEVLKGVIEPPACPLYGSPCTPEHPVGACMVSSEGTCAAHYRFLNRTLQ